MSQIFVRPTELRKAASEMRSHAQRLDQALDAIEEILISLRGNQFLGHRADAVQAHYRQKKELFVQAERLVLAFAEDLDVAATNFEKADRSGSGTPSPSPAPQPEPAPAPTPTPSPSPEPTPQPVDGKVIGVDKIKNTIKNMHVTTNPEYLRHDGNTYCNIFVMDTAKKLGIPLPEFLDWNKDGNIDDFLNANEAISWLDGSYNRGGAKTGVDMGWKQVSQAEAAQMSQNGSFVVAGWTNPNLSKPGHMAIIRPESTANNIRIAQAGANNYENAPIAKGFGDRQVTYFVYAP